MSSTNSGAWRETSMARVEIEAVRFDLNNSNATQMLVPLSSFTSEYIQVLF